MKKPREFIIGIYYRNGKMFAANSREELEREFPEFIGDFKIIEVVEKPKDENET